MNEKIRVALIYKKNYNYFQPEHFDKTTYYFFFNALERNEEITVTHFPSDDIFDLKDVENKFDVILLANNWNDATPEKFLNINRCKIPIISRTGDPHSAKRYNQINFMKTHKIDYLFGALPSSYIYKFYPKNIKFKIIIFGLEKNLYQNLQPYSNRIKNKILCSGAIGKTNIKSRIANAILNPKRSGWYFYKLRTLCTKLSYVDYSGIKGKKYENDDYPTYLSRYRASIAATTFYPTQKYWEIPAAGCLTFMEITSLNDGMFLGFRDGINAIFINEQNYKEKFEEYLSDIDNPKWEKIAKKGQEHVFNSLNNEVAVQTLVSLMKTCIDEYNQKKSKNNN